MTSRTWVAGRTGDRFAGIPGRRIFVAAPLPDAARAAVADLVSRVRALAVPGEREVRWVRLDGLHVTLRFLGPTPELRIATAAEAVRVAAAGVAPFEARLDGAGSFPKPGRPRALWLGIGAGAEALGSLATSVDDALAARGWSSEARPFKAHLTLARSDGVPSGAATADLLVAAAADLDVHWAVDRITLFESITGSGPARYEPIEEARLSLE